MAFTQYNSAAFNERRKREQEYEEYLAKKMSEEEDERQKKSFSLDSPNVIPNYIDAPTKKGEGNLGQDKTRTGKIYTYEPPNSNDGKMSPALRAALFRPIEVAPINPRDVMKRGTRKKHSASSARYYKEGRAKTAKIYGNKNKEKPKKVKRSKSAPRGGRRKRRKQRGGNTASCETAQLNYNDLANKIEKILEVKVPNWWRGMNDGPYKLVEYNVEDSDAAEMGNPGIFGIGLETPDGQNGFFIPRSDIDDETVRLCAPSVDNDTAPAGGRRKKRRKTRKNKRSKKRRVKKRKTRKRRRKRR